MFDISVKLEGEKVVIAGMKEAAENLPRAIIRGLTRAGQGVFREAFAFLSGPGAKKSKIPAGGYPVPVRKGWLRRALNWVKPGETKSAEGVSFTAGAAEAMIYDSAPYAKSVHEGTWTNKRHGRRAFLTGGFEKFNQGDRIKEILMEEVGKEIHKAGLK